MDEVKEIGAIIRRLREGKGLSQEDLARAVGRSWKTVQRWETGGRQPQVKDLVALATVLDVSYDTLLSGRPALVALDGESGRMERRADRQVHTGQYLLTRPGQGSSILVSESHHPKQPILDTAAA